MAGSEQFLSYWQESLIYRKSCYIVSYFCIGMFIIIFYPNQIYTIKDNIVIWVENNVQLLSNIQSMNNTKLVGDVEIHLNKKIGEGTFGIVYEGIDKESGEKVAIKVLNKNIIGKDQYLINALKKQIKILYRIKSPHIVSFKKIRASPRNFYLVQELCEGDLLKYLKQHQNLNQKDAINIFKQLLKGFYELIVIGVVHRDLKLQNILYKDNVFKICDFGLAQNTSKNALLKTTVGTESYQSPQQILGVNYNYKCDIWALGAIFYELLYRKRFISKAEDIQRIKSDFKLELPNQPEISEESKNILRKCLKFSEEERAEWEDLFESPLFKDQLPSISLLKQKLHYALTKIRYQVQQQNIDLDHFFEKFKKNDENKELDPKQFSKMLLCLAPDLHIEEIKYIFWNFDSNGDGKVSLKEFKKEIMEYSLYKSIKPRQLHKELEKQQIQSEGSQLSQIAKVYEKFIDSALQEKIDQMHEQFISVNKDNKGLDKFEFGKICQGLCPNLTEEQLALLFKKFDENQDGAVSYEQFFKYLCKVVGINPRSVIKKQ